MTSIKSWQKALYELKVTYASLIKDLQRVELELQDAELSDTREDFAEKVRDALHLEMSTIADLAYYFRQLAESVTVEEEEEEWQEQEK